jgi:transcriptional regulator with XRE-family HTH domain
MAVDADPGLFAETFERLRLSRGWTPAEVARRLDVRDTEVSRWRRGGTRGGISIRNVRKIADLFEVDRSSLEQLAGFEPSVQADDDPELTAYVERFRSAVKSVPRAFWPVVTQASVSLAEAMPRAVTSVTDGRVTEPLGSANSPKPASRRRLHPRYQAGWHQTSGWCSAVVMVSTLDTRRPGVRATRAVSAR